MGHVSRFAVLYSRLPSNRSLHFTRGEKPPSHLDLDRVLSGRISHKYLFTIST